MTDRYEARLHEKVKAFNHPHAPDPSLGEAIDLLVIWERRLRKMLKRACIYLPLHSSIAQETDRLLVELDEQCDSKLLASMDAPRCKRPSCELPVFRDGWCEPCWDDGHNDGWED